MTKLLPIVIGLIHLALVICLAISIATSSDLVAVNGWLLFLPIDFPISLGIFPIEYLVQSFELDILISKASPYNVLSDISNFWVPILYFGIIGSLWWFYIAKIVTSFIGKKLKLNISDT